MQLGMIGLGRMGANMVRRLMRGKHSCVVYDRNADNVKQLVEDDETGAQAYRYVRTGTDHFSLAFTYDCIAWSRDVGGPSICAVSGPDDDFYCPILHDPF